MSQRLPSPENSDLLKDLQAEVSAESAPLLQFIVRNAQVLGGIVLALLLIIVGMGIWRWHESTQASQNLEAISQIQLSKESPANQIKALKELAEKSSEEYRYNILLTLALLANKERDFETAATAYSLAATSAGNSAIATTTRLAQASMLAKAGKADNALIVLQQVEASLSEDLRSQILPFMADVAIQANNKALAAELYERLAKQADHPDHEGHADHATDNFYSYIAQNLKKQVQADKEN